MCVILACDKELPKLDVLESCETMNSDGGGVAWNEKDKNGIITTHFKKGLTAKQINALIVNHTIKVPAVIHFRIATVGDSNAKLTHPFVMSKDSRLDLNGNVDYTKEDGLLFHNGTVSEYKTILKESIMASQLKMLKGDVSDSRAMAFVSYLYGKEFLSLIEGWNKFCVIDKDGIHKFGSWVNIEKGITGSNDYFKNTFSYSNAYSEDDCYMYNPRSTMHKSYTQKEIDNELNEVESENLDKLEDEDEIQLLREFDQEVKNKIRKSVKEQIDAYKKMNKRKSKQNMVNFLRVTGWKTPEKLNKKNLKMWVQKESGIMRAKMNDLDKANKKHSIADKPMSSEEYDEIFKLNESWISRMQDNPDYYTPRC